MSDVVAAALRDPASVGSLTLPQWDVLVRQARTADLLSRLAVLIEMAGLTESVPEAPRRHLEASRLQEERRQYEAMREVEFIRRVLSSVGVGTVVLKGCAYLVAGLPAAFGRGFSDIDILVPRDKLPHVEAQLMQHGWATTCDNAYDQRYYRKWMHELPPFRHIRRGTALDVHHNILPDTARTHPDPRKLLASAIPVPDRPDVYVLSPTDMVLHSMTHLFHNEEFSHGLRDLSDIDLLLRHFGNEPDYWPGLLDRARELQLVRPLSYGLLYANRLLGTPVPESILCECDQPHAWLDFAWRRALRSPHWTAADGGTSVSLFLLYVRAHALRMPIPLLAYHLTVKALRLLEKKDE